MKEPSIETPHRLFSTSARYYAPVFQRLYVWGESQLDALIEDILSEDKVVPQFLGAIVLKDLGKVKGPTSPMSYLMIDGQQRLTTLFMLFAATAEVASAAGVDDIATYIQKEYLLESRSPAFAGQPKLVPTVQDRTSFWGLLETAFPAATWNFKDDPGDGKTASKIEAQWARIQSKLVELVYDVKGRFMRAKLASFLEHLQNKLNLIVITLDEQDDANVIFSKLNASGVPLSLADLVRNEVFSKFQSAEGGKAAKFYEGRWHLFERSFQKTADLNAFFPIYSYIAFAGSITKAGAFPELQKRWSKTSPQKILSDLEEYAPSFRALISGSRVDEFGKELNGMINRFSRMPRTTVTWPYILQLLHAVQKGEVEKRAVQCLEIVEAFLVRRALSGIEPTGLHSVFKGLWQSAGADPEKVKSKIITRTIKVPGPDELGKKLREESMDTRVILPYVLSELERDLRKKNRYDAITDTVATIEHVLPKKRGAEWKVGAAKDYDALVGLIGNLVPLSDAQNKSAKDDPWSSKRKRFAGSNFFLAQKVARNTKWDQATIRLRTNEIATWVQRRWPLNS
jgi:hypothetical protein